MRSRSEEGPAETSATEVRRECRHCGTPFTVRPERPEEFCCRGCEYVFQLIHDEGFDRYYELRGSRIAPVKSGALHARDYGWLEKRVATAESDARGKAVDMILDLQGISCIGCVWLVERIFNEQPGALRIEINAQLGQMKLTWAPGIFDVVAFAREIQKFGYLAGPRGRRDVRESRRLLGRLAACGAFAMNAMFFTLPRYLGMEDTFELARLFELLTLLFATLSLLTGGSYFIARAWRGIRSRILHIDLPIAAGVLAAYAGSLYGLAIRDERFVYLDFVAVFVFLMLLGRWLQERAVEHNRNRILQESAHPERVTRLSRADGRAAAPEDEETDVAELEAGDHFLVLPGHPLPVRGKLHSPEASLSLEWINGESDPRVFAQDRILPAGGVNIGRTPLEVEALETWNESLLARLLARSTHAFRDRRLEQILRVYLAAVLVTAVAGGLAWWLATGMVPPALQVLVSILVVSCPCALGVSYPLASELSVARMRGAGLFVRESSLFQRLVDVRKIIFDKTGTLTLETPVLENTEALVALDPENRQILASMVEGSLHPVARSLREELLAFRRDPAPEHASAPVISERAGFGIEFSTTSHTWTLGRPGWNTAHSAEDPQTDLKDTRDAEFRRDGIVLAAFRFRDALREDAKSEIAALSANFGIYLLSGDRQAKVDTMARTLGLPAESAVGEQTPDEKAAWIRRIDASDTLFIGDGANDALAFDAALCRGTPVVDKSLLEQKSDFFFTGRRLEAIRELFKVAGVRRRALRQVFAFSVAYNVVAVGISLAGHMNPLAAAVLMPLSSLVTLAIVGWRFRRAG